MVEKSSTRSQGGKTRLLHWVESDEPLVDLGRGVQFPRGELQREYVVAFLEGFDWLRGSSATVRLLGSCPSLITRAEHWSEIIESTREAVLVFLSDEGNLSDAFLATSDKAPPRWMVVSRAPT